MKNILCPTPKWCREFVKMGHSRAGGEINFIQGRFNSGNVFGRFNRQGWSDPWFEIIMPGFKNQLMLLFLHYWVRDIWPLITIDFG